MVQNIQTIIILTIFVPIVGSFTIPLAGKDGADIRTRGEDPIHVPVAGDVERVDPTGVGDAFRAGFLVGLAGGLGHERCAQMGSVLAAHVLETVGTQEYTVTREGFLARFAAAYGDEAMAEITPLVRNSSILAKVDAPDNQRRSHGLLRNPVPDSLDAQILSDAKPLFERGERMQLTYNVRNTHRAVGTRLSAEVTATMAAPAPGRDSSCRTSPIMARA